MSTMPRMNLHTIPDQPLAETDFRLRLAFGFRPSALPLIFHLHHAARFQAFEKLLRSFAFEFGILDLNAKKESIDGGSPELRHIKNGMMGLRQPVENQHGNKR